MSTEAGLKRQFFDMLMESQWWPSEQLRDYQRSQLSQLLRHAKQNVPFYEHRLDAVVRQNGDIDWDRWNEIPIVRREDLREHRAVMQAKQLPEGHGPVGVFETSGSTGIAVAVTVNHLSTIADNGLRWRAQSWNGVEWSHGLLVRDGADPAVAAPPEGKRLGVWGPPWDASAREGYCLQINKLAGGADVLALFRAARCSYLNTGPKTAHTLALDAVRLGLDMRIEAFLCQGGAIGDDDREIVARVFGARLIEAYSAKEGGQMAHPCPAGHLHVNSEAVLVEIIGENGQQCGPGEQGRVVVTPLFQTAQPLIRYDQGDRAVAGGTCSCGRHLPTIDSIAGRELAMFRHPDGRAVVQVLPNEARRALNCDFMQIAQIGPNDYEVRFVPKAGAQPPDEARFVSHFHSVFFDDARIAFLRVETIPLTRSGKLLEYVSEWRPA